MDLIQRCRASDEDAFAALFYQHKNLVYKTACLLLGDAQAAEDALQEVFVKVYRSLETLEQDGIRYGLTADSTLRLSEMLRVAESLE